MLKKILKLNGVQELDRLTQKEIEGGKNTPAKELFEGMEKTMDEQSYVPKNVNEKDIGEMELMFKNRFNKGRKDNANGGIQTMLGE